MRLSTEHRNLSIIFFLLLVSLTGCAKSHITVSNEQGSCCDNCYRPGLGTTFEAYAKSLPGPTKLKVGFDIDDTLLFSSPVTHFRDMQIKRCMEDEGTSDTCDKKFTTYYLKVKKNLCLEEFDQSNESPYSCIDDFSLPKRIAKKLLALHLQRGDIIYIITARRGVNEIFSCLSSDQKAVAKSLRLSFDLDDKDLPAKNILFAQKPMNKHNLINKHKLNYYYGDADTDITESLMTEATPIRILRSPASLSNTAANPGKYGEIVILRSEN